MCSSVYPIDGKIWENNPLSDNTTPKGKVIAESRARLTQFMNPHQANPHGNVHGGEIMKLVDEGGALAAMRHAGALVVTVAMDSMTFNEPVLVGHLVTVDSQLTYAGTTSMEVRVEVTAENPITGVKTMTNTAYLVYVAIDAMGRPQHVPPLIAASPEDEAAMAAARERQAYRKRQRELERARP
jgi:acyl-CoA hydrolase